MSSPSSPSSSFLLRLRTRTRRPADGVGTELPEDHWHAGDPRLLDGSLALSAPDLPGPRRPVDRGRPAATGGRTHLSAVPEVDLRTGPGVVDLRGRLAKPAEPAPLTTTPPATKTERTAQPAAPWSETSTWLG